jgi:hypothetical protein
MPRARLSCDWPSQYSVDLNCKPIPDKGFEHPKESDRRPLTNKNIAPAGHGARELQEFDSLAARSRREAVATSSQSKLE